MARAPLRELTDDWCAGYLSHGRGSSLHLGHAACGAETQCCGPCRTSAFRHSVPSTPQRTGHAVMHSSTIVPPGATSVVPCSECWETRRSLATMGLPAGRVHWKTVSTRIVGRRADERGMVRKHPSRTPGVRFALASCGKGWEGPRILPSWRRFGSVAPPSEVVMFCQPQVLSPSQCSKALTPAAGPCRGDKRHGCRPNSRGSRQHHPLEAGIEEGRSPLDGPPHTAYALGPPHAGHR
jgi:hypothetical protein